MELKNRFRVEIVLLGSLQVTIFYCCLATPTFGFTESRYLNIVPHLLYACEAQSLTLLDGVKFKVSENRVFRKIQGPIQEMRVESGSGQDIVAKFGRCSHRLVSLEEELSKQVSLLVNGSTPVKFRQNPKNIVFLFFI